VLLFYFSVGQFANQAHESITWFPEFVEINSPIATKDHDKNLQDAPLSPKLNNKMLTTTDDSCTHISVIKTK